jgi:isopenicillin-N epimerase
MFADSEFLYFLLWGIFLAASFYLLRHTIDRNKGVVGEIGATTLPILCTAALILTTNRLVSRTHFGLLLGEFIQIEFIALQILVAVRLIERSRIGESVHLVDMFRITTVVSLFVFVVTFLNISDSLILGAVAAVIFAGADLAVGSAYKHRILAILFVAGFILNAMVSGLLRFDVIAGLNVIAMLAPQVFMPSLFDLILRRSTWIHFIALRLACWRQSLTSNEEPIHGRTLFDLWQWQRDINYLNHGSFGAVPMVVRNYQHCIRSACENEPMDWFTRRMESKWLDARFRLAVWLGTKPETIAFCENATAAMNELANWFPLKPGDEVVLNNHEYGAVKRIWNRKCERAGAKLVEPNIALPIASSHQIIDAIASACNERTRLVIISHITSPTAIRMPVEAICASMRERGIATCVDGPHALLQEGFRLYRLGCDFYTASCHKWLCAPVGSGFIYVDPKWHCQFEPARLSWGRLPPSTPENWADELLWTGTRDYSAYLAVPAAINFFANFSWEKLDQRNHDLACYARRCLCDLGCTALTPEGREWFGWMVSVALPQHFKCGGTLQHRLWEKYRIEIPIFEFEDRYLLRVSCHLYTATNDIDRLVRAVRREISSTEELLSPRTL